MSHRLLRGAFRPSYEIYVLRALVRQRHRLWKTLFADNPRRSDLGPRPRSASSIGCENSERPFWAAYGKSTV